MKKVKYLVMAVLICSATILCACGSTKIEGRPSAVVDEAQDLKRGSTATVTVTGFVSDVLGQLAFLTDGEDDHWASTVYVQCSFEGSEIKDLEKGDRVTISGELKAEYIEDDSIWLHKCTIE